MIWWEMGVDHIFGFMGVDLMGVNQIYYPSHITAAACEENLGEGG